MLQKTETITLKQARAIAGAVSSRNSKMPGSSFATSTLHCKTGGTLKHVEGSTCSKCYAERLENMRPSVKQGWLNNYLAAANLIEQRPALWAKSIAMQITRAAQNSGEPFHRWFDSGDLDSVEMLAAICHACELTPHVKHWLPTREATMVAQFIARGGKIPDNLIIRISSTMIGDAPRTKLADMLGPGVATSTVTPRRGVAIGHACPARHQGIACGDCRACWDRSVPNVSYPQH